jgi:hypothetical protein
MRLIARTAIVAACLSFGFSLPAAADGPLDEEFEIFGWVEWVKLLDGELRLKAKLDTGAANSSLDATNIERFRKDGQRWVRFTVSDPDSDNQLELEKPLVRNVRIIRHDGNHQRRPVIKMDICVGDRIREVEVNLIDRSNFIYPMLLGRSALEGFALIDSGQTFQNRPRCEFN